MNKVKKAIDWLFFKFLFECVIWGIIILAVGVMWMILTGQLK